MREYVNAEGNLTITFMFFNCMPMSAIADRYF